MDEKDKIIDVLVDIIRRQHVGYTTFRQIGSILTPNRVELLSERSRKILMRVSGEERMDSVASMNGKTLKPPEGHILSKSLQVEALENGERR